MFRSATSKGQMLGIFAKEPLAGQAKTRLARATSPEWACRVAQAILEDSLDRFAAIDAARVIAYAPASSHSYFADLARDRFELIPQSDGDLGERLQHFFEHLRQQGFSRIVAVGGDSPTLPLPYLDQAFTALDAHEVVIGPAFDGGYYLLGSGLREIRLFDDIPWSTSRVLETTLARVQQASARLALLPPWYDVDTVDDWAFLRGHVRAMRLAGIDPGVPRVERLIQEQSL